MNKLKFKLSKLISSSHKIASKGIKRSNSKRILMYHSIADKSQKTLKDKFTIGEDLFYAQMTTAKEVFSSNIENLEGTKKTDCFSSKILNITFDDGYKDNLSIVAPIMDTLQLPFSVFITTNYLKEEFRYFLSDEELKELSSLPNVSIGSHAKSHINLTRLSKNEIINELRDSKAIIEDLIGKEVKMFSYPHGGVNKEIRDLVGESGYEIATNSRFDTNKNTKDLLMLNRIEIWNLDSIKIYKQKLEGHWDWMRYRNKLIQ